MASLTSPTVMEITSSAEVIPASTLPHDIRAMFASQFAGSCRRKSRCALVDHVAHFVVDDKISDMPIRPL
jgi:hypothetical protein